MAKIFATAVEVGFVAIQFVRPAITHPPPVTAEILAQRASVMS